MDKQCISGLHGFTNYIRAYLFFKAPLMEYGYSGLDQVLEVEDNAEVSSEEDVLGPEDGENLDDGLEYGAL